MNITGNETVYFITIYTLLAIFIISLLLVVITCNNNKNEKHKKQKEQYNNSIKVADTIIYPDTYIFEENKVFVCLTTIPDRIKTLWFYTNIIRFLKILENTNIVLFISIPYKTRLSDIDYNIPANLLELEKENDNLILYRCNDYGPFTKVSGPLLCDDISDDSCIIICDDDQLYNRRLFVHLALAVYHHQQQVISPFPIKKMYVNSRGNAIRQSGPWIDENIAKEIMGYQSFAFVKKLLLPMLNIDIPDSCYRIDDHTISFYLEKNNINIVYLHKNRSKLNKYVNRPKDVPNWVKLNEDEIDNKRFYMIEECRADFGLKG